MSRHPCFVHQSTLTLPQLKSSSNLMYTLHGKFMQIATHKSLKPSRVLRTSGAGKWAVPGKKRNFQSLALAEPSVAAKQ
jgi:hypothetical protein